MSKEKSDLLKHLAVKYIWWKIPDETLKTPDYWSTALATLDYRGLTVGDLLDAPAQYERFTAREVQDTFASYDRPAARFLFVITPRS